ncbi:PRC-barrel domain-containing protein [Methanobrevibacter sp. OttesenSCG-928-K11]|nr:PRC-barrel domain-containing protein [Methanobrevibacter sp. OttesenSCG-928-K11]MDL2270464.1 PRC-barrel domain-containing protein [Methanobrevibacter sp. OttesenSCG-928-I08]
MRMKSILGALVLDNNANEVGKVLDLDFDEKDGKFNKIIISLKKGLISNDELEIDYSDINTIGDYVLLNKSISEKDNDDELEE